MNDAQLINLGRMATDFILYEGLSERFLDFCPKAEREFLKNYFKGTKE